MEKRCLVILDDAQTFDPENNYSQGWELHSSPTRFPSLPAKFNRLLELAPPQTEAFLVWEQDDYYLPSYVSAHAVALEKWDYISKRIAALNPCEYSKPSRVLSDYPGKIVEENAAGRFHSSIAFRRELIERIGGWPDTKRADFDQQLMGNLQKHAKGIIDPWPTGPIPFVYRWHSGVAHGQSTMERGPEDTTWYDRAEQSFTKVPFVGKLEPKMDEATKAVFRQLGYTVPN